jgi:hypothetical protein
MFKSKIASKLDAEIMSAFKELDEHDSASQEYGVVVDRIATLQKLKSEEKSGIKPPSVDTMLIVGANLFGVLWLARFEREHVIKAPQAMKMVIKPRT